MQLALNKATNDLFKPEGGGVTRARDGRYTIQAVQTKLLTILGEYRLNPGIGWLRGEDFNKNPDLFDIEIRAREQILSTKGVLSVDNMNLELKNRILTVSFEATTVYGGISLTIPWSQ